MTRGRHDPQPKPGAMEPGEQTRELRDGLDALGIRWQDASDDPDGDAPRNERTRIMRGGSVAASCVFGPGTWGYPDSLECKVPKSEGPLDRPMTAKEVLDGVREAQGPGPRGRGV